MKGTVPARRHRPSGPPSTVARAVTCPPGINLAFFCTGRSVRPHGVLHMQQNPTASVPQLGRRALLTSISAAAATASGRTVEAAPAQTLRIAMTASDLPTVTGIPNNGGEGFRFLGFPAYDGVINWDYTPTIETADAIPGLFESWTIDPGNPTRWIFTLRGGVTFHDGSPLTIDDIVWNLRRVWDLQSPQYDAQGAPI